MDKENKYIEDQAWSRMEAILDQELPQKEKRRGLWFWSMGVMVIALVSIVGYNYVSHMDEETSTQADLTSKIYATNNKQNDSDAKRIKISGETEKNNLFDQSELRDNSVTVINSDASKIENEVTVKEEIQPQKPAKQNRRIKSITTGSNQSNTTIAMAEKSTVNLDSKSVNFDSTKGRASIKNELNKVYEKPFDKDNENQVVGDLSAVNSIESKGNRNEIDPIGTLESLSIHPVFANTTRFDLEKESLIDVVQESSAGEWMFGGFSSYQYLDKYFKGYDMGVSTSYRSGRFAIGLKLGYERLENKIDPVLGDARVAVIVPDGGSSLSDVEVDIYSNTKAAGFGLNDIILDKRNLMSEFTLSAHLGLGFNLSSGIGYKRLLRVTTREIKGLSLDDTSNFDPTLELAELDSDQVLNNPTVNRNRFYIPFEINFSPLKNISIGVGSQLYLNDTFQGLEEKNKSLYARVGFQF